MTLAQPPGECDIMLIEAQLSRDAASLVDQEPKNRRAGGLTHFVQPLSTSPAAHVSRNGWMDAVFTGIRRFTMYLGSRWSPFGRMPACLENQAKVQLVIAVEIPSNNLRGRVEITVGRVWERDDQ
jgi:hypothetical protein